MTVTRHSLFALLIGLALLASGLVESFAPAPSMTRKTYFTSSTTKQQAFLPSSIEVSVDTVDPTTFLSDILGGLINTPAILAVPIVAALSIAGLLAYFLVSYANPEVEDDE